ncbi:hypothetical protein KC318_g3934 [Hortaea werneckii]|uniref:Glucose-methanol-choline oxidoreductase N-terminal domain-containing protein n=1 Tax=Hortaea werneckii TaxID=91943 RepID=A0A3M7BEI3_HORWE|nr:hypothetical protein KC334_g6931 [Hortaea werneckii]KAI7670619.1 hypothetical protein KC318_g3934 [Hortaea werneckii]RMY38096.1 hypothetical protein D0866_02839 [Hortaea werneckii]
MLHLSRLQALAFLLVNLGECGGSWNPGKSNHGHDDHDSSPFTPPGHGNDHHGQRGNKHTSTPDHIVDYAIVGGGPAGLVLAEQLSQDESVSVVVFEAGPDGTNAETINIPALAPFNSIPTPNQFFWNFTSQPDPNLAGRTPVLNQGRTWGGGSAVNYMEYCRGAPSVFDEWADLSGDEELRWEALLRDFRATTHFQAGESEGYEQLVDLDAYGDGPLEVSRFATIGGFDPHFFEALKSGLDLPEIDVNSGHGLGVSYSTESIRVSNRTREYALPAYGWQMADRPNVQMLQNAWASKIGFDGKRAVNVTYYTGPDNEESHTITAREIIVTAGAIGSPRLLMLSGVGPKDHLEEVGIPVIHDSPGVGQNLKDHHFSVLEVEVTQEVESIWQYLYNTTFAAEAHSEYQTIASGFLARNDAGSFAMARVPDDVFHAVNDSYHPSLPGDRGHLLYQYVNAAFVPNSPNVSIASPFVALAQPEAAGSLRLASSDFRVPPLIQSNYYGSPGDKAAILYGYKKLREILHSDIMKPVVIREVFPGPNVTTDEQLWDAIQQTAQTFYHPHGSLALRDVVDGDWRVMGTEGLRVVDSSTFPTTPTCHIQADVYAVAYRAARRIRRDDGGRGGRQRGQRGEGDRWG